MDGAGANTIATCGATFLPKAKTDDVVRAAAAAAEETNGGSCRPGAVVVSMSTTDAGAGGWATPRSVHSRSGSQRITLCCGGSVATTSIRRYWFTRNAARGGQTNATSNAFANQLELPGNLRLSEMRKRPAGAWQWP